MRADYLNRKFNLEEDSPWSDDPETEELNEGYDEETDDEDDENSPPSISSLGIFVPFIC